MKNNFDLIKKKKNTTSTIYDDGKKLVKEKKGDKTKKAIMLKHQVTGKNITDSVGKIVEEISVKYT